MRRYFAISLAIISMQPHAAHAQQEHSLGSFDFKIKAGANIGGAAPMGIPAQIREIKSFNPLISLSIGGSVAYWFAPRWSAQVGISFENKSMTTTARVKEYAMQFGDFAGLFTGEVQTNVKNGYLTIPLAACFRVLPVLSVHAGFYYAYLLTPSFYGSAYGGHIRQGSIGAEYNTVIPANEPSHFAFSNELSHHDFGALGGVEWNITTHFFVAGHINWGLRSIFPKSFAGISMRMYNIFCNVSFGYLF